MTAAVIPLRRPTPASGLYGPCESGTIPGQISAPCGDPRTRPYPGGPRCDAHRPRSGRGAA